MEKCKLAPKNGIDSSAVGKCYIEAQSCKETLVQRQLVGKKKTTDVQTDTCAERQSE